MAKSVELLIATHKGAFIMRSNSRRQKWQLSGPYFKGLDVHHFVADGRSGPSRLYALINSGWVGNSVQYSDDGGKNWVTGGPIEFPESVEGKVNRVWCLHPGVNGAAGDLLVGVDPAGLFRSSNGGKDWHWVRGLSEHPTRDRWVPGFGGMMVHSICVHPENPNKIFVGISAAGVFATEDGGKTWEPRNRNVRADFMEEKFPEVGQCVHCLAMHPARPEVLFQQNHCGVYRSDNEGRDWVDISEGLPSRFGFSLTIHPHQPSTIYVIPEEGGEFRCPIEGKLSVYRSTNGGEDWERLHRGLPQENAFVNILRQSVAADGADPCGLYIGTNTGQILYSLDDGDSWALLANWLPPIFSLSCRLQ